MKSILSRIPSRERRVFYVIPLFIQWIVGVPFESEVEQQRAARRGMVLGLFFLVGISLIYLVQQTLSYLFTGQIDYGLGWAVYGIHAGLAVLYGLGSLVLVFLETTGSGSNTNWLDGIADRLERRLSV